MTVSLSQPQEKSPPEPIEANGHTNDGPIKTKYGVLRLVQIILSLVSFILIRPRSRDNTIEYLFIFLTLNSSLLTVAILCDRLYNGKLHKLLLPQVTNWDRLELFYNGVTALLFYVGSFGMLASFIGYYDPDTNVTAGALGMGTCFVYAYGWWLLSREQAGLYSTENEIKKTNDAEQQEESKKGRVYCI